MARQARLAFFYFLYHDVVGTGMEAVNESLHRETIRNEYFRQGEENRLRKQFIDGRV